VTITIGFPKLAWSGIGGAFTLWLIILSGICFVPVLWIARLLGNEWPIMASTGPTTLHFVLACIVNVLLAELAWAGLVRLRRAAKGRKGLSP
jgi:hypothetical protein